MSGKLNLFHMKMFGSAVYEKSRYLFSCSSESDKASYTNIVAKTAFKKNGKIDLFSEVSLFWHSILFL